MLSQEPSKLGVVKAVVRMVDLVIRKAVIEECDVVLEVTLEYPADTFAVSVSYVSSNVTFASSSRSSSY